MKENCNCALKTISFVVVDLLLTISCLSWHGANFSFHEHFLGQISTEYSFSKSTIDFLLLAICRTLIISFGCALVFAGVGAQIFAQLRYVSLSACILFCCFSPVKLLALSDASKGEAQPTIYTGDWLIFVHNLIFSLGAHFLFGIYVGASRKLSPPPLSTRNGVVPSANTTSSSSYEALRNSFQDTSSDEEGDENLEKTNDNRTAEIIVRLLQYCKDEWIWHLSGFTWLFVYSLTRIFVPYYTGQVIASVVSTEGDKYVALLNAVKFMVIISVVSAFAGGLRGGSFEYAYARINRAVRRDLFSSLVKQEVAFFDEHKTGEITSRLTSDTQTMSDTVSLNINIFLRNMVQMGGSMIFMMALCWKLSLIPFIIVPIFLMASKIFGVYYDVLSEKAQNTVAFSNDVAEEVLSTMRTVRSFACEDTESERFFEKLSQTLQVTKHKAFAYVGFMWVSELFQTVINVAVLWYGGHLVLTGQLEKDLLVSFLLYQMQLADNIRQLGEVWTGLMQSVGASRKVFEYVDREPKIDTNAVFVPESGVQGRIEFHNVHFSYPTRPDNPILKGLSFTVEPGEVVALVGPSGGGKSSCIALIEHFYAPVAGRVLIDGIPVSEFEHHFIHKKVALVGQEPVLFARSVAENISYGLDDTVRADVIEAAKLANAHAFILNTHDQYETNVGEKGSQMSGGQKQRIAIARALIRQPAILLLDEATSALDTESEHLVQEAIYKNLKGRSVILIAHRLSTVEKADKIVLINKGRVEQMGTHEELLAQEGTYRQLVQRQMIGGPGNPTTGISEVVLKEEGTDEEGTPQLRIHDGSGTLSVSPRNIAHSLLATSFSQSLSSLQSK